MDALLGIYLLKKPLFLYTVFIGVVQKSTRPSSRSEAVSPQQGGHS